MPETRKELIPVRLTYTCDTCGQGKQKHQQEFIRDEEEEAIYDATLTLGMAFVHYCSKCGARALLPKKYPQVVFIEKPDTK